MEIPPLEKTPPGNALGSIELLLLRVMPLVFMVFGILLLVVAELGASQANAGIGALNLSGTATLMPTNHTLHAIIALPYYEVNAGIANVDFVLGVLMIFTGLMLHLILKHLKRVSQAQNYQR